MKMKPATNAFKKIGIAFLVIVFSTACAGPTEVVPIIATHLPVPLFSIPTELIPSPTRSPRSPTATHLIEKPKTPEPSSTLPTIPTLSEPSGCQRPPEDYGRMEINGMQINQRTYAMLQNAQILYGGELELTGYHVTQGSYTNSVSASFGTHSGGGAVDLSVIQYGTYQVLYEDIPGLIHALRVAGFAAWLRDFDQLYPGSPIHVHAIAIGDAELSPAAQEQLTGTAGYFRGYNGLPQPEGQVPVKDEFNGPILCQWMLEAGYQLFVTPSP